MEGCGSKLPASYDMTIIRQAPNEQKAARVPRSISCLDPGIHTETWTVTPWRISLLLALRQAVAGNAKRARGKCATRGHG